MLLSATSGPLGGRSIAIWTRRLADAPASVAFGAVQQAASRVVPNERCAPAFMGDAPNLAADQLIQTLLIETQ
jgi:hypothetical protein